MSAPSPRPPALDASVLAGLFFLSGSSALIYEILWTRMLTLTFGTGVRAVATVTAAFMAGLALGAWVFGRLVDRRGRELRTYALLEVGIGLSALALPVALAALEPLSTRLYRLSEGAGAPFAIGRFGFCFAVLLVPTTLMGGTLPALARHAARSSFRVGRVIGRLYGVNTLGAAAGCVVATFLLIERLGVRGATVAAAALNMLIAVAALAWSRRAPRDESLDRPEAAPARAEAAPYAATETATRLVLLALAVSGFAALGYQVAWTRLLAIALKLTTIQSFSILLTTFLVGLALGATIGGRIADRSRDPMLAFGVVQALLALVATGSVAVLAAVPDLMPHLRFPMWWGHVVRIAVVSLAVMLPPTILMGIAFPLAGRVLVPSLERFGRRLGLAYAANTTGAILGALAAGFLLVPALGTAGAIRALAWSNLAAGGAILALRAASGRRAAWAMLGSAAVAFGAASLLLPAGVGTALLARSQPGAELIHAEESAGATVHVYAWPDGGRLLKVDGAGEVPTDPTSIQTFRLLGNLPLLLHPAPRDALVIAYGGGITLAAVERHRPRRLDCVELVPGVVAGSRHFAAYNHSIFERMSGGPVELIVGDGRNHVLRTERRYDVIISDSTHPATADSWVLYTREFYELCRARLTERGIVAQWLPLHGLSVDDYRTILRTFREVFPHATLWLTTRYGIMLGTLEPLSVDYPRLREGLAREELAAPLAEVGLDEPAAFLATLALDEAALGSFAGEGPINTDDRPRVSFTDRSRIGTTLGVPVLLALVPRVVETLDGQVVGATAEERAALDRRLRARKLVLAAQLLLDLGQHDRARALLERALSADASEPEARRLLEGLDGAQPGS